MVVFREKEKLVDSRSRCINCHRGSFKTNYRHIGLSPSLNDHLVFCFTEKVQSKQCCHPADPAGCHDRPLPIVFTLGNLALIAFIKTTTKQSFVTRHRGFRNKYS